MTEKQKKPGPEPDRVKPKEKDWRKAVKKALGKKRPPKGWPEENEMS